jgi:hypothetical protein
LADPLPIGEKMTFITLKIGAWMITGLAAFTLLWGASEAPERQLQPGEQITTTLISIVPTLPETTTTTTTVPKGCAQYVADAITAGWPADQAPMLARVMFRESRCNPLAYNAQDTQGGSFGLMQINGQHRSWLIEQGYITNLDDLFVADTNLRISAHLYSMVGWSAWASTHG